MSKMSGIVLARVTHGVGVSHKTGKPVPYDFAQAEYLAPASNIDKPECKISSWGFELKQIGIRNDVMTIKAMSEAPKLVEINLILEPDPQNPTRNVVVGWESSKS